VDRAQRLLEVVRDDVGEALEVGVRARQLDDLLLEALGLDLCGVLRRMICTSTIRSATTTNTRRRTPAGGGRRPRASSRAVLGERVHGDVAVREPAADEEGGPAPPEQRREARRGVLQPDPREDQIAIAK
jgi:hypothetical protein